MSETMKITWAETLPAQWSHLRMPADEWDSYVRLMRVQAPATTRNTLNVRKGR